MSASKLTSTTRLWKNTNLHLLKPIQVWLYWILVNRRFSVLLWQQWCCFQLNELLKVVVFLRENFISVCIFNVQCIYFRTDDCRRPCHGKRTHIPTISAFKFPRFCLSWSPASFNWHAGLLPPIPSILVSFKKVLLRYNICITNRFFLNDFRFCS